ncbi:MAG: hypothetical protein JW727_05450 [Candidatus Aenigmarchaeota archaeon]|nr:hypothetical protein [Candidatus Aenigmarchaeota archaeon]
MAKVYRGSGLKLDSPLLRELYEQKDRDEMRPHGWEIDGYFSKAIRSVHREINEFKHGTNGEILKERKRLAIAAGKAFDSPKDLHCKGCGGEVSAARDKSYTLPIVRYYCAPCSEWSRRFMLNRSLEDLRDWRNNPRGTIEEDIKKGTNWRKINVESDRKDLEDYLEASKKQKYYVHMEDVGYKCPHFDCGLVIGGEPIPYTTEDEKKKRIYVCGVCEREI